MKRAHEYSAAAGVAEEELRSSRGDREHHRVHVRDAAGPRDLAHRGDVGAGIAAADEVFAGPRLQAEGERQQRERERRHARRARAAPRRTEPAPRQQGASKAGGADGSRAARQRETSRAPRAPARIQAAAQAPAAAARNSASSRFHVAPCRAGSSQARNRRPGARNRTSAARIAAAGSTRFTTAFGQAPRTAAATWRTCASPSSGIERQRQDLAAGLLRHREVARLAAKVAESGLQVQRDRVVDERADARARASAATSASRRGWRTTKRWYTARAYGCSCGQRQPQRRAAPRGRARPARAAARSRRRGGASFARRIAACISSRRLLMPAISWR